MQLKSIQRIMVIKNCTLYLALYYFLKSLMFIFWIGQVTPSTVHYVFMVILYALCVDVIKIEQHLDRKVLSVGQRFLYAGILFLIGSEVARYVIDLICSCRV